jgi:hypothetical protein
MYAVFFWRWILDVWAHVCLPCVGWFRAPPPLPELSLSEDVVLNAASTIRVELNKILAVCHDVALGKDFKLFIKVKERYLVVIISFVFFWVVPLCNDRI